MFRWSNGNSPQTFWDCHEIYAELHRVAANSAINSISAVSQLRTICRQRKHSSVGWVAPDWSLQQLPISMVATVTRFWDVGKSSLVLTIQLLGYLILTHTQTLGNLYKVQISPTASMKCERSWAQEFFFADAHPLRKPISSSIIVYSVWVRQC